MKKWFRSLINIRLFNELNDGNKPVHADEKEIDRQHDVTEFKKLSLTNNNHIVLLSNFLCLLRQSFRIKRFIQKVHEIIDRPSYINCLGHKDNMTALPIYGKYLRKSFFFSARNPIILKQSGGQQFHKEKEINLHEIKTQDTFSLTISFQ